MKVYTVVAKTSRLDSEFVFIPLNSENPTGLFRITQCNYGFYRFPGESFFASSFSRNFLYPKYDVITFLT